MKTFGRSDFWSSRTTIFFILQKDAKHPRVISCLITCSYVVYSIRLYDLIEI